MKKIVLLVLFATLFFTASAKADTITAYTISFTGGTPAPTAGSFSYDSTVPSFSSFYVTWDGITFDLTSAANSPFAGYNGGLPACVPSASGPEMTFALLTGCGTGPATAQWQGFTNAFPPSNPYAESYVAFFASDFEPNFLEQGISISATTSEVGPTYINPAGGGFSADDPISTPEPGTVGLTMAGIGLFVLVMRKRIA